MDNAELLALVQDLSDQFAATDNLETNLRKGLRVILSAFQRPGGLLLIQAPEESQPYLTLAHGLPRRWKALADGRENILYQLSRGMIQSGEIIPPNPGLDLAAGIPLLSKSKIQGALFIQGPECSNRSKRLLPCCSTSSSPIRSRSSSIDRKTCQRS
jgi:hypothetical protein